MSWRDRTLAAAVVGASVALLCTLTYLHWAPVGQPRVDGLHGRYLIPLGPLAFAPFQNTRLHVPGRVLGAGATLAVATSVGLTVATLLLRYC